MHAYLAVDLGAESGRVIRGVLEDGKLSLEEISRFANGMYEVNGKFYWNYLNLFRGMKEGFRAAAQKDQAPESVGVDTWGVDFALLAEDGSLLGLPVAYRDPRTDGMMDRFFENKLSQDEVYARTGIQFLPFNTLFQFYALSEEKSPFPGLAKDLLFTPDYFHYLFSGEKTCEYTIASTSQCLNIQTGDWDDELLSLAGAPRSALQKIIQPGDRVGTLRPELQKETGLGPIAVIAPGSHDTASAVAASPAEGDNWAFISSGTWSLMGLEIQKPIATPDALKHKFTNEGGVCGTIRFLKNIMGLWLVQRCRADFDQEYSYAELTQMAKAAEPFRSIINPDDLRFLNPPNMPQAMADFCNQTGQPAPENPAQFIRCALESLALEYRSVVDGLEALRGKRVDKVHILGGGTQNKVLNQMTANATGLPVVAGPIEATATGNLLTQAISLGHLDSLDAAREVVRASFPVEQYAPENQGQWEETYKKFQVLKVRS